MRFRLVPTDDRFFTLFSQSADNAAECARRLRDLLVDYTDVETKQAAIVECERQGDAVTDAIVARLNSTFVTPFDREDIHALAEELDDAVDDMLEVAHRMVLTSVAEPLPEFKQLADILVQMAEETVVLMSRLSSMKNVRDHLDTIDRLESEGDAVYRRSVARLFSGEFEALEVLRQKDILEALEGTLNRVEDVSNVVESIVLKHA